jgi:hypothetical protein
VLRSKKAAVIHGGGVICGAAAPAFARAGRAGGADSRGAVAGRGPVTGKWARAWHDCRPCPGESFGSLTRTWRRTAPRRYDPAAPAQARRPQPRAGR